MRLFYLFLLFFTSHLSVFGQTFLDSKTTDLSILQDSIRVWVNADRDSLGLKALAYSNNLELLAKLQGGYCLANKKETHQQQSKKYATLLERAANLNVENGTVQEIIVKLDFKKTKIANYAALYKLMRDAIAKKTENFGVLQSKNNIEMGFFADFSDENLYITLILGSKVVFSKALKTPKNYYKIDTRAADTKGTCDKCFKKLAAMPSDISYDLTLMDGEIFFAISNEEWFHKLFRNKKDGIAVDIVLKSQYPCDIPNVETTSPVSNGYLLAPLFASELYKKAFKNDRGNVFVPVGKVPEQWKSEEYEFNILIIQDNILCQYGTFFQVPFDDGQTLNLDFDLQAQKSQIESIIQKKMTFEIPFELGKYTFDAQDLKPLADSLRLAHYTITDLSIIAYSSVEGNEKINQELQQNRAKSMVDAIQSYQTLPINAKVQTAENWTAFYADIQQTSKAYLATKAEDEIRLFLNTNRIIELDTLIAKHRKGLINIELERKKRYGQLDESTIIKLLKDSNYNQNEEKYQLIDEVFLSEDPELMRFLAENVKEKLVWNPESKTKIAIDQYLLDSTELDKSIETISQLLIENNKSPMIQYNYYVLKLLNWQKNIYKTEIPKALKQQLSSNKNIDETRLNKLRINYNILEAAYYTEKQQYELKNQNVSQVMKLMALVELSDEEKFRIGKFLASNHQYKAALNLLDSRTKVSNVHEDLLFLYINLSIIEDKIVQKPDYRATLANAAVVNKSRFCTLFNSAFNGGITFQLLQNQYLKRSYCEICE